MTTTRVADGREGFRGGIDVRVSLRADVGSGTNAFDGAWFPRSRDLTVEVPELIAALDRRGLRVERFTYPLDAWQPAPRKVVVDGRVVRTGGFRSMDPGVVCLSWAGGNRRADLLVVPPETDVITGVRALRLCTRRGLPRSPQMVLAAARSQPLPQVPDLPVTRAV
ncbi:hypothetical protein SAMN05660690_1971 [Geodermatophilus telluris]|uniref:Uncharacterized protein n=1 Tax=Geodermatophilus telluris TaxID=1190417 RepID=A0A1G6MPR6_9ACTN|nr:DUF5994 family protein [Geodermatophilus telluris]SDC57578.1 hypothetical protein SAMN05660690_1971 [Geodermatophilus telluris]